MDPFKKKLSDEKSYFEDIREKLMKDHYGMYIAVCDKKIAGVGKTMDEAFRKAWQRFRTVPMYIGRAVPKEMDVEEML